MTNVESRCLQAKASSELSALTNVVSRCLQANASSELSALTNVQSRCLQAKAWMMKNELKLNEQKTEVLLCGPSPRTETVPVGCLSAGEASIPFSDVVKTLAVTLDAELSMEQNMLYVVMFF